MGSGFDRGTAGFVAAALKRGLKPTLANEGASDKVSLIVCSAKGFSIAIFSTLASGGVGKRNLNLLNQYFLV